MLISQLQIKKRNLCSSMSDKYQVVKANFLEKKIASFLLANADDFSPTVILLELALDADGGIKVVKSIFCK